MINAFLDSPALEFYRGELIFGFNIYPADRIDKPLNGGKVDLDIIVEVDSQPVSHSIEGLINSVDSGMCQLVHLLSCVQLDI